MKKFGYPMIDPDIWLYDGLEADDANSCLERELEFGFEPALGRTSRMRISARFGPGQISPSPVQNCRPARLDRSGREGDDVTTSQILHFFELWTCHGGEPIPWHGRC